jgi:hypothetical protein
MQSANIDEQLHQLALTAQAHPFGSRARQQVLTQICTILRQPGLLKRRANTREDVWREARQTTLIYVCEKIDNYDPTKGCSFLAWVNGNFKWRQRDAEITVNQPDHTSLDAFLKKDDASGERAWEDFNFENIFAAASHPDFLSAQLKTLFEEDPDGRFATTHIKGKPEITFQRLVLRVFHGITYQELSTETGASISTLSSFFQRKVAEFSPSIREYFMNG